MNGMEKPANQWERRFRHGRNAALAVGGAALASYPASIVLGAPGNGFLRAALLSADTAFTMEGFRFMVSPDSDRKREIIHRASQAIGALWLYMAVTWGIEGATLVANNKEPVTLGAINIHNSFTRNEDWLPDAGGEIAAYAIVDGAVAIVGAAGGIAFLRSKQKPFQAEKPGIPT